MSCKRGVCERAIPGNKCCFECDKFNDCDYPCDIDSENEYLSEDNYKEKCKYYTRNKIGDRINHISLDVHEIIKNMLLNTLEKDLEDNETICPVCGGIGIIKRNQPFGVENNKFKLDWYDNEYLTFCPNCFFGVVKCCRYCGKQLMKGTTRCNCDGYKEYEKEEMMIKRQETIAKAKEIDLKDAAYYIYDEQSDKYFTDEDEFVMYYWQDYLDGSGSCSNFDEYFEYEVPKILWNCERVAISMDAKDIIESACEELYEDAYNQVSESDKNELQKYLDRWCKKQTGTTTYYPCYKEYVKVQKEWFDQYAGKNVL